MISLLKFILLLALAPLAWAIGLCILSIGIGSATLVREAYESDRSMWYYAGGASAFLKLLIRSPSTAIIAITVALIGILYVDVVENISEKVDSSEPRSSNPPPVIAPVLEDTLQMPTEYPFKRIQSSWPPFIGHRFPLGRGP